MRNSRIESKWSPLPWGVALILVMPVTLLAQANTDDNAATLYLQANALIKVECPSASNEDFPRFPLYSPKWQSMEKDAMDANQPAFELARKASAIDRADWPPLKSMYLNSLRNLANQLADAAGYFDLNQRDAEAIEKINDLLHLADCIDRDNKTAIQDLVGEGIRALTMYRLMIITSNGHLTSAADNHRDLQVNTARALIQRLLSLPDADVRIAALKKNGDWPRDPATASRMIETLRRIHSDCVMAAMSLSCQIFQLENQRWPDSLEELVPKYLPHTIKDPWGDGKQSMGYILIVGGLPDGADRPLVYSRCNSTDGLFYRTDGPWYQFYRGDGSSRKWDEQKQGGEFRDVTRWEPVADNNGPTTRPLP